MAIFAHRDNYISLFYLYLCLSVCLFVFLFLVSLSYSLSFSPSYSNSVDLLSFCWFPLFLSLSFSLFWLSVYIFVCSLFLLILSLSLTLIAYSLILSFPKFFIIYDTLAINVPQITFFSPSLNKDI